jgi:hypothetical protein
LSDHFGTVDRLRGHVEELAVSIREQEKAAKNARDSENNSYRALAGVLLARWPYLNDPWHPRFAEQVINERASIEEFLANSPVYRSYLDAVRSSIDAELAIWVLRIKMAPLENLGRSLLTQILAGRLKAKGGGQWRSYRKLLTCERFVPGN